MLKKTINQKEAIKDKHNGGSNNSSPNNSGLSKPSVPASDEETNFWDSLGPIARPYTPLFQRGAPEMSREELALFLKMPIFEDESGVMQNIRSAYYAFYQAMLVENWLLMKMALACMTSEGHCEVLSKAAMGAIQHRRGVGFVYTLAMAEIYGIFDRVKLQLELGAEKVETAECLKMVLSAIVWRSFRKRTSQSPIASSSQRPMTGECEGNHAFKLTMRFFSDTLVVVAANQPSMMDIIRTLLDQQMLDSLMKEIDDGLATKEEYASQWHKIVANLHHRISRSLLAHEKRNTLLSNNTSLWSELVAYDAEQRPQNPPAVAPVAATPAPAVSSSQGGPMETQESEEAEERVKEDAPIKKRTYSRRKG